MNWLCYLWRWMFQIAFMRLYFGGDSSSSSSQSTSTQQYDMRVNGGNGSSNVSATNSTVTVTDAGAVSGAFGFAEAVTRGAFNVATASQNAAEDVMTDAMEGVLKSQSQIADAYANAKAGEYKIVAIGALAVVGLVAAKSFRGKA